MNIIKSTYKKTPAWLVIAALALAAFLGLQAAQSYWGMTVVSSSGIASDIPGECVDIEGRMPKKYDNVEAYRAAEPEAAKQTLTITTAMGCTTVIK